MVLDLLRERTQVAFTDLLSADTSRLQILVTFLATLELVRTRMIDVNQDERFGPIMLTLAVSADTPMPETLEQL
jgi:chromatin segregation and condensation protein Rec8/ScpA/Scc1 (kleisin family)